MAQGCLEYHTDKTVQSQRTAQEHLAAVSLGLSGFDRDQRSNFDPDQGSVSEIVESCQEQEPA